jgi:hypothetical protein
VAGTKTVTITKYGDFNAVVGTTGATLHILNKEANHPDSMRYLEEAGLRLLKYQEILLLLMKDERLKNHLKGKSFRLEGYGLDKDDIQDPIYTIDEKGELKEIPEGVELSNENKVRVWSGTQPLSLDVISDVAAYFGWRFDLYAFVKSVEVEDVVVGVPKEHAPRDSAVNTNQEELLRK